MLRTRKLIVLKENPLRSLEPLGNYLIRIQNFIINIQTLLESIESTDVNADNSYDALVR